MKLLLKILAGVVAFFLVAIILAVAWVKANEEDRVSVPDDLALAALVSDEHVDVTAGDWVIFMPVGQAPVTGLVFYPGGFVDPRGYAAPFRRLAEAGYLVVAMRMPLNLASLAPNRADEVREAFPGIKRWYIGGHSLGGVMASQYAVRRADQVAGLVLWDSHPMEKDSLVEAPFTVTLVHRADEAGTPPPIYRDQLHLFPADARITPVRGGNHMNFGNFQVPVNGYQEDVIATVTANQQQDIAVSATLSALESP